VLCKRISHHDGPLAAHRRIKLLTKRKSRLKGYSIEVLIEWFIVIEDVGELGKRGLEIVGHNPVKLLLHLSSVLVIVEA
jgi:hypothetical protein